jgi:hypothetical protein
MNVKAVKAISYCGEQWADIKECPNYKISSYGRVMAPRGNIIKSKKTGPGYEGVRITGKLQGIAVHRLVAVAFVRNEHGYKEVNHIDGDKWNNRADNLEWCSRLHNIRHSISTGLRKRKLDDYQIVVIKSLMKDRGNLTVKDVCDYFKIESSLYFKIQNGKMYSNINL